jgi:hypothetical protein
MEEAWPRERRKYELKFPSRMAYLETSYDSVHHDEVSICGESVEKDRATHFGFFASLRINCLLPTGDQETAPFRVFRQIRL